MKKEEIAPYVNLIYGTSPAHTTLLKSLQSGGVLEQLLAVADLIRNDSTRAYSQLISGPQDVVYERDDLIKDSRATLDTLAEAIRALIRDKNALYEIVEDLELEKLKADDASCCAAKKISLC